MLKRGVGGVTRRTDDAVWATSALGGTVRMVARAGGRFPDPATAGSFIVNRPRVSANIQAGASGCSGAIAGGHVSTVVRYDAGRRAIVWLKGVAP